MTTILDPALTGGLGEPAARALLEWAAVTENTVTLDHWITVGRSGAVAAAVRLDGPHDGARKLLMKSDGPRAGLSEYARHRRAVRDAPEFAARRLAEPFGPPIRVGDGAWITLQRIAGGCLGDLRPGSDLFAEASWAGLTRLCAALVGAVLDDWAGAPRITTGTVGGFLAELTAPSFRTGKILPVIARSFPGPRVTLGSEPLPNPFAFPSHRAALPVLTGRAHGDLHFDNVLISAADPDGFRLVDLAKYASDAPLARDPAHLALRLAAAALPDLGGRARAVLLRHLLGADDGDGLPRRLTGALAAIRTRGDAWARGHGLTEEWRDQTTLALWAGGLFFAGRRNVPAADRSWFVELAARAAHVGSNDVW